MKALSSAQPGALYTIQWNLCTNESAALTAGLGLCPGRAVFLANRNFCHVTVRVDGKTLVLSNDIAARIKVSAATHVFCAQ